MTFLRQASYRFCILCFCGTFFFQLNAQRYVEYSNQSGSTLETALIKNSNERKQNLDYESIKGDPYLEEDYLKGYVKLFDKRIAKNVVMQYDIYGDEFFFVNEGDKEMVLDLRNVLEIYLVGKEENYLFRRINPENPEKFYDILYEEEGLLIYHEFNIVFQEGKELIVTKVEPTFSRRNKYFILSGNNGSKNFKLKKKNILNLFNSPKRKQIENYLEKNNIKLKSRNDFKMLFNIIMDNRLEE